MKIYILPVKETLQPSSQNTIYPPHNRDYGVEQDFLKYLLCHKELVTSNPTEADWHYLPVFWTRWHVNHNYAIEGQGELKHEVDLILLNDDRTFTVCQYDDGLIIPSGNIVQFLASRKNKTGIDIPLLCEPHKKPFFRPSKKLLATFAGTLTTHPIRQELYDSFNNSTEVLIYDGHKDPKHFLRDIMSSYVAICPRGYGGSSFRFFEAMQLGTVPCLLGDIDVRPFKKFINWDEISMYAATVLELQDMLRSLDNDEALQMGKRAFLCWKEKLCYQKWCKYLLIELESMT